VTATEWDADSGTLSVTLDAERPMDLFVATPGGWRPVTSSGDTTSEPATTRVTATPGANHFDFSQL
jgi:hypothetical protein